MSVQKRLVEGLAKKDADTIEKFVFRVLNSSLEHWKAETNEALSHSSTVHQHDLEADEDEKHYNYSFRQWHLLRQMRNNVKKWLDPHRKLPEKEPARTVTEEADCDF